MLQVFGLRFTYPGYAPTLEGVDLKVRSGESVFLLGPSGSGKSTLLRCLAGLETPQAGRVEVAGVDVTALPPHRRRVGLLFQEPALFPHLRARANVAFPLRYRPDRPRQAAAAWEAAETQRLLELVQLPRDRWEARPDELSGGQRSRVALARALAARPRAILLDEPLASLDRPLREELGDAVRGLLRKEGMPALWVTHDREEARRLGDAVWELREGRLAAVD